MTIDEQIALYEKSVKNLTSFMKVSGMFELQNGQQYQLFDNLNENAITWKNYDMKNALQKN